MSTKVSWLWGNPEKDGRENDYHLYFDYADFGVHLEVNGEEVPLPPKLRCELKEIYEFFSDALYIFAKAYVLAKKYGKLDHAKTVLDLSKPEKECEEVTKE